MISSGAEEPKKKVTEEPTAKKQKTMPAPAAPTAPTGQTSDGESTDSDTTDSEDDNNSDYGELYDKRVSVLGEVITLR